MPKHDFSVVRNLQERVSLLEGQVDYFLSHMGPLQHNNLESALNVLEDRDQCTLKFLENELRIDIWKAADIIELLNDLGLICQTSPDLRVWEINKQALKEVLERREKRYADASFQQMYRLARHLVLNAERVSLSGIRRALRIGYPRASAIMKELEREGIVSLPNLATPGQPRRVLRNISVDNDLY